MIGGFFLEKTGEGGGSDCELGEWHCSGKLGGILLDDRLRNGVGQERLSGGETGIDVEVGFACVL